MLLLCWLVPPLTGLDTISRFAATNISHLTVLVQFGNLLVHSVNMAPDLRFSKLLRHRILNYPQMSSILTIGGH